jgi:hypothetical protein
VLAVERIRRYPWLEFDPHVLDGALIDNHERTSVRIKQGDVDASRKRASVHHPVKAAFLYELTQVLTW